MPFNNVLVSSFAGTCFYYEELKLGEKLKKKLIYFSSKMLKRLSKKKS